MQNKPESSRSLFVADVIWFLRPTLGILLCFLVAAGAAYQLSEGKLKALDEKISEVEKIAEEIDGMVYPASSISPREVVQIQTEALANKARSEGTLQCMQFASPANRLVTGPLEKFSGIVRGTKFLPLSNPDAVIVGKPMFQASNARVLVTVLSKSQVYAYVWVLEKQTAPPHVDCWMTDGVFPLRERTSFANEI